MHSFSVAFADRGCMFRLPHIIIIRLYTWSVKKKELLYIISVQDLSLTRVVTYIYKDICLLLIEKPFKYKIILKRV